MTYQEAIMILDAAEVAEMIHPQQIAALFHYGPDKAKYICGALEMGGWLEKVRVKTPQTKAGWVFYRTTPKDRAELKKTLYDDKNVVYLDKLDASMLSTEKWKSTQQ